MFYAHYVLSKRGPLARIWLAAHWDKKLTKAHVFECNLEDSVETIISPQVKMALRTSGHLLLGVVRIYNRKAKYLLADCNEAFVKIKMAFRSGVVDLPEESREAQHNQIYIVEEFPNFDTPLPDITDFDVNRHLTLNQSRIDEITMPDEAPTTLPIDESFGGVMVSGDLDGRFGGELDSVFYKGDDPKAGKDMNFMGDGGMKDGFGEMDAGGILGENFTKGGLFGEAQEDNFLNDGFGRREPEEIPMDTDGAAVEEQDDIPPPSVQQPTTDVEQMEVTDTVGTSSVGAAAADVDVIGEKSTVDDHHDKIEQEQVAAAGSTDIPGDEKTDEEKVVPDIDAPMQIVEEPTNAAGIDLQQQQQQQQQVDEQTEHQQVDKENEQQNAEEAANKPQAAEETAFALEPLNVLDVRDVRIRRKRKLIIDHLIELDGQTMREQLKNVEDIVTTLDMAPPTKRLMLWKEMGGVDKLFTLPCQMVGSSVNFIFTSNLHNTIPQDLIDITGTQLHQRFGESILDDEQHQLEHHQQIEQQQLEQRQLEQQQLEQQQLDQQQLEQQQLEQQQLEQQQLVQQHHEQQHEVEQQQHQLGVEHHHNLISNIVEQQQVDEEQQQQPQPHDITESSVQVQKDATDASMQLPLHQDTSIRDIRPNISTFHDDTNDQSNIINNDLSMNRINAVNISDDEYDAMSNGVPSVGESVGPPSPTMPLEYGLLSMDNVLGEQPIKDTLDTTTTATNQPTSAAQRRLSIDQQDRLAREQEPEGTAYADDLEDLRYNKRTQHLINDLDRKFSTESQLSFFRLSDGITRKQAVSKFYSILVLAKQEAIQLEQSQVFADVYIKKGPKFDSVLV